MENCNFILPTVSKELYFELAVSVSSPDGRGAEIESPTYADVVTDLFVDKETKPPNGILLRGKVISFVTDNNI